MTRGSITYSPGGQFNFPRSYVVDLRFYVQHTLSHVTQVGRVFYVDYSPVPSFLGTISFREEFYDWNSNVYSLDFIIEENYYQVFPDPTKIVLPITVGWASSAQSLRKAVNVVLDLGVDVYTFELPPAPADYWPGPPIS